MNLSIDDAKKKHVSYMSGWWQGARPKPEPVHMADNDTRDDFDRGVKDGQQAYQDALHKEFERLKKEVDHGHAG